LWQRIDHSPGAETANTPYHGCTTLVIRPGAVPMKQYFVYIMASYSRTTYIGVTSNLEQRVWQHKTGVFDGHTSKYNQHRLVYVEEFQWVHDAIGREKQLKGWGRPKKVALIETMNPRWIDLSAEWYGEALSGAMGRLKIPPTSE
jgi:putative endonuclease